MKQRPLLSFFIIFLIIFGCTKAPKTPAFNPTLSVPIEVGQKVISGDAVSSTIKFSNEQVSDLVAWIETEDLGELYIKGKRVNASEKVETHSGTNYPLDFKFVPGVESGEVKFSLHLAQGEESKVFSFSINVIKAKFEINIIQTKDTLEIDNPFPLLIDAKSLLVEDSELRTASIVNYGKGTSLQPGQSTPSDFSTWREDLHPFKGIFHVTLNETETNRVTILFVDSKGNSEERMIEFKGVKPTFNVNHTVITSEIEDLTKPIRVAIEIEDNQHPTAKYVYLNGEEETSIDKIDTIKVFLKNYGEAINEIKIKNSYEVTKNVAIQTNINPAKGIIFVPVDEITAYGKRFQCALSYKAINPEHKWSYTSSHPIVLRDSKDNVLKEGSKHTFNRGETLTFELLSSQDDKASKEITITTTLHKEEINVSSETKVNIQQQEIIIDCGLNGNIGFTERTAFGLMLDNNRNNQLKFKLDYDKAKADITYLSTEGEAVAPTEFTSYIPNSSLVLRTLKEGDFKLTVSVIDESGILEKRELNSVFILSPININLKQITNNLTIGLEDIFELLLETEGDLRRTNIKYENAGNSELIYEGEVWESGTSKNISLNTAHQLKLKSSEEGKQTLIFSTVDFTTNITSKIYVNIPVKLDLDVVGNGTVDTYPKTENNKHNIGTAVNLRANPQSGNYFLGWFENNVLLSQDKIHTITMSDNRIIQAKFATEIKTELSALGAAPFFGESTALSLYFSSDTDKDINVQWANGVGDGSLSLPSGEQWNKNAARTFKTNTPYKLTYTTKSYGLNIVNVMLIDDKGTQGTVNINVPTRLTVLNEGDGEGSVDYEKTHEAGSNAALAALPQSGSIFSGWYENGHLLNKAENFAVQMNSNRTIQAKFDLKKFKISSQTISPATVSGTGDYKYGQTVSLSTTTTDENSTFSHWEDFDGVRLSSDNPYQFKVSQDFFARAVYVSEKNYRVNVTNENIEFGKVQGAGLFSVGQTTTLTAIPEDNCLFLGWYNGNTKLSPNKTYSVEITSASDREQNFIAKFKYNFATLNVLHKYFIEEQDAMSGGYSVEWHQENFTNQKAGAVSLSPRLHHEKYVFLGWFNGNTKLENISLTAGQTLNIEARYMYKDFTFDLVAHDPKLWGLPYVHPSKYGDIGITMTVVRKARPGGYKAEEQEPIILSASTEEKRLTVTYKYGDILEYHVVSKKGSRSNIYPRSDLTNATAPYEDLGGTAKRSILTEPLVEIYAINRVNSFKNSAFIPGAILKVNDRSVGVYGAFCIIDVEVIDDRYEFVHIWDHVSGTVFSDKLHTEYFTDRDLDLEYIVRWKD